MTESRDLNLRADDWITAEAVFEIVGAGKEIPHGFKLLGSDDLIIHGSWTAVALCAVVSVHNVDAYLEESKYVVTTHIYVGEKHWSIPFPIHFLVPGLDNQLVFYWTFADYDLPRTIQVHSCRFSFSVEPEDGNVKVTSFGARIILNKDQKIQKQKLLEYSMSLAVYKVFRDSLSLPSDMLHLLTIAGFAADTDLQNLYSSFKDDLTNSIKKIILDHRNQQNSLYVIHKFIKCIYEVNQEVLSGCGEEWRHAQLFPLVYDYYQISHGTSQFCNDFVGFLKDVYNSWISVKLALDQIVVNSRANDYTSSAILQQINDLKSSKGIRLSDSFVISFAHICKKIAAFSTHLVGVMPAGMKFKSLKVLMKVSRLTIAGIFSMVATHMCHSELLQEMKDTTSNRIWLNMTFGKRSREIELYLKSRFDRELQIWDFNDDAILLQELKNKIACPNATKGIEEEMLIVTDKLEKNIDYLSKTIEDMSTHAYKYIHDIGEAGITYNQFIADGKLQVTKLGFCFERNEDILQIKRCKDPMREAVNNLFRATAFLPPALHSYLLVFRGEKKICRLIKSNIKAILHAEQDPFLDTLKIIRCLCLQFSRAGYIQAGIDGHKEWLDEWFRFTLNKITNTLVEFLKSFKNLLTCVSESWSSVMLALEHILLKSRAGEYTYEETLRQLNIVRIDERIEFSDEFFSSFVYICDKSAVLIRMMNSVICNKKLEASNSSRPFSLRIYRNKRIKMKNMKHYGEILSLTNNCILRFVATCMGDFELLQEMEKMNSNSKLLHIIQCFSRKSGKWFDERGCIKKASNGGELQIWDLYGNTVLLQDLKNKMAAFSCFTVEAEEEMVIVIHKLKKKLNDLSDGVVDKTMGYNYYY